LDLAPSPIWGRLYVVSAVCFWNFLFDFCFPLLLFSLQSSVDVWFFLTGLKSDADYLFWFYQWSPYYFCAFLDSRIKSLYAYGSDFGFYYDFIDMLEIF
jgi:hypothetical protein